MNTATFDYGTRVRLSVDEGAATVGIVIERSHVRDSDGMTFWLVDWNPLMDDGHEPIALAANTLVSVCEWSDEYPDEWGLACSEPGVPTVIVCDCSKDAERIVTITKGEWVIPNDPTVMRYCLDHSLTAALDLDREGCEYTITEM